MNSKEEINGMIVTECNRIKELLLNKNNAYNNSLHEAGLLFPMDVSTGIKARINDKLNRIKQTGLTDVTEDTLDDLIGYLVHLNISIKLNK